MDTHPNSDPKTRFYALLVTSIASFVVPFLGSATNVAVPDLGHSLGLSTTLLNWVVTSYLLSAAVLLLPFGRAGDMYGRRKLFVVGAAIFPVASLLCAFANSGWFLISARVMQGVGSALMFSTAVALVTAAYPPEKRGRVLGVNVASVYSGLSAGPVIGGLLTHSFGWRSVFLVCAGMGLFVFVVAFLFMKMDWRDPSIKRFDWVGSILLCSGLTLAMYSLAHITTLWPLTLGALAILAAFVYLELHSDSPIVHLELFRIKSFTFSSLAALIHYSATFALGYLLSIYLQHVKDINPGHAGFILLCQPVCMTLISPAAGLLSDKVQPRVLATLGMALTLLGLIGFQMLTHDTPVVVICALLAWFGAGFGLFSSPNSNAIMGSVPRHKYGFASAMMGTMRMIGQSMSMALVTFIFSHTIGTVTFSQATDAQLLHCIHVALAAFACLCFLAMLFSAFRSKMPTHH